MIYGVAVDVVRNLLMCMGRRTMNQALNQLRKRFKRGWPRTYADISSGSGWISGGSVT